MITPQRSLDVRRTSIMKGLYEVTEDDQPVMVVRKPSFLRRRYEIHLSDRLWTLEPVSAVRRAFELRLNGRAVGRIDPASMWRRSGTATFPAEVPVELQLICLWFILLAWKRAAESAGGGSS